MITDNGLRLATAEVTAGNGVGGLGEDSVTLALDESGITATLRSFREIGGGEPISLAFNVDTSFTCGTFGATIEFQLVSLPINATKLTDTALGDGKQLLIDDAGLTILTDTVTVVGHGLPVGAPVYLTDLTSTAGVADDTIYYVIPLTADTFQLATTIANAIAGTPINLITLDGTADINFIPTVHASSGGLQIFGTGIPSNQSSLIAGSRFLAPLRPLIAVPPDGVIPAGQTLKTTVGSGPPSGTGLAYGKLAATAQRYYYLRYVASATIAAGAITCDLVTCGADALNYPATGVEVVG